MATADAFHAQPKSFEYTPFLYGADHIMRAGWLVAALGTQHWGDAPLVDAYREDEYPLEKTLYHERCLVSDRLYLAVFFEEEGAFFTGWPYDGEYIFLVVKKIGKQTVLYA